MNAFLKKLSMLILCSFGFGFCMTPEPYTDLVNELKKKTIFVEYKWSTYNIVNNVKIKAPIIKSGVFRNIVEGMVKRDQRYDYCDGNKGEVFVTYKVLHLTDNLISIRKDIEIMHCYPSVVLYSKFVNVLTANGKILYLGLTSFDKVKADLLKAKQPNDECVYNLDELKPNLFFLNNKFYVDVIADKVCELQAPIELSKNLIKFDEEDEPKEDYPGQSHSNFIPYWFRLRNRAI